jgi:hypothetical protein
MNDNLAQRYRNRLNVLVAELYLKNKKIAPETMKSILKKIDLIDQLHIELSIFIDKFKNLVESGATITKTEISEADINNFNTITKRLQHNTTIISNGLMNISSRVDSLK